MKRKFLLVVVILLSVFGVVQKGPEEAEALTTSAVAPVQPERPPGGPTTWYESFTDEEDAVVFRQLSTYLVTCECIVSELRILRGHGRVELQVTLIAH